MSRQARTTLFLVAGACLGILLVLAAIDLPGFGGRRHPYRDQSIPAAVAHQTANVVTSINFDLRGLDTLGEETILLASVLAVAVLLRPTKDETERRPLGHVRTLDATRFVGYVLLPVTAIIGLDVMAHGALTPGGGFQGGVVFGTGLHLLYVSASYDALERLRPLSLFEWGEALGAGAFACLGISAALAGGSFLVNLLPLGHLGDLFSAGTVPILSGAVGIEVASGVAVLLSKFLAQAIQVRPEGQAEPEEEGR
ncbi:MAG: Na+/H+ antiporter MnhB subunit-related protein [Acidimicrobiaceae bacterium]|nr:Na+/H+ antiporter MnhB subunit-related protein [Acidimicrobiaceae bacterium]